MAGMVPQQSSAPVLCPRARRGLVAPQGCSVEPSEGKPWLGEIPWNAAWDGRVGSLPSSPGELGWINPYPDGKYQLWVKQTQYPKDPCPPWGAAEHRGAPTCCWLCSIGTSLLLSLYQTFHEVPEHVRKCCLLLLLTPASPAVFKEKSLPISPVIVPLESAWLWNLMSQVFCGRNPLSKCNKRVIKQLILDVA